jgi:hypothetical protein
MSACTTAAFSVAPSTSASGCLMPSPSTPIAAVDLHHQDIKPG